MIVAEQLGAGHEEHPPSSKPHGCVAAPLGFDLYSTKDGAAWRLESEDGFEDPWNYGVRSFVTDPATGDLYLGTANPFFGCQVWRKRAATSCLPKWR